MMAGLNFYSIWQVGDLFWKRAVVTNHKCLKRVEFA